MLSTIKKEEPVMENLFLNVGNLYLPAVNTTTVIFDQFEPSQSADGRIMIARSSFENIHFYMAGLFQQLFPAHFLILEPVHRVKQADRQGPRRTKTAL